MHSEEIWKPIPGYEGLYEASSFGRIKSLFRLINHPKKGLKTIPEKILKLHIRGSYYFVNLYKEGIRNAKNVNILIAMTFFKEYDKNKVVNHIDKNRLNNNIKNLEVVSNRENVSFSYDKNKTSSKLVGVCVSYKKMPTGKIYKQIHSEISVKGNKIWLGTFKTEEEAHKRYLEALKEYCLENKYATKNQD